MIWADFPADQEELDWAKADEAAMICSDVDEGIISSYDVRTLITITSCWDVADDYRVVE